MQPNQTETKKDSLELALEELSEELRLPLVMYYFDGQSVKTIAERLNISGPAVYLKLRNATKQLHELLTGREI